MALHRAAGGLAMRRRTIKDQELVNHSRLARAWRKWHREQLEAALAGVHGAVLERLMRELKDLQSARTLVDFTPPQDWSVVDADTRLIALHQINKATTKLREPNSLDPFPDPLPGPPESPSRITRKLMPIFPP